LTKKPSKVLIIGSGPIIIGQTNCHSEGVPTLSGRLKNLGVGRMAILRKWTPPVPETLRCAQGDSGERSG
jgi:hypothetical protein